MTLNNAMSNVIAGLQYAPHVSQAVMAVEASVDSSVPGATKKQLVLSAIAAAAKVGESVPEAHVQLISALVDIIVSALNASGIFGHYPAAPPAAAPVK
jgi:hypothetical protein